jgi:hypothetical protein
MEAKIDVVNRMKGSFRGNVSEVREFETPQYRRQNRRFDTLEAAFLTFILRGLLKLIFVFNIFTTFVF